MIIQMSYVVCDECGAPGAMADDAAGARREAKGFVQVAGRDLCWRCDPSSQRCTVCGVRPKNWLTGCTSRDGIHTHARPEQVGGGQGGR